MTKKQRLDYLISTISVLSTGFLIYAFIGSIEPLINNSKIQSFFFFGLLGGLGFSVILSSLILTTRYISKKSTRFKLIASLLWPLTFACAFYFGVFSYLPYQIYNIVKIVKDKSQLLS